MFFLAIRHLINRPQQTILTFLGITIGCAGYIVFSGLQLGYQDYVIDRLVNVDAYVRISPRDEIISQETFRNVFFPDSFVKWVSPPSGRINNTYLTNIQGWRDRLNGDPRVVAHAPQLIRELIFTHGKFSIPIRIVGVNAPEQSRVTNIERDIIAGSFADIARGDSLVLLGEEMMKRLGCSMNGSLQAVNSHGVVFPLKIVAVYRTGVKQIDSRIAYSSISTVQKITQSPGEVSDLVVRLKDVESSADTATEWQQTTADRVESWDQAKEDVRVTLKTQGIVRNVTTFTIMLIVAFGIYNILNMVVNQKKREIAILRSVGYDQMDTIFLFLVQGVILGLMGALSGMGLGAYACSRIETIKISIGQGHMPISWDAAIYLKAFVIVLASSVFASIIPARNAGKLSPIDIIRNS
jgi:lipoprotein-releasing system permease protein